MKVLFKFIVISLFLFSCSNDKQEKKIILYIGCENYEVIDDVLYSYKNNESFFKEKKVEIEEDTVLSKCGYKFVFGDKIKTIESAMTDIDLKLEAIDFFQIK